MKIAESAYTSQANRFDAIPAIHIGHVVLYWRDNLTKNKSRLLTELSVPGTVVEARAIVTLLVPKSCNFCFIVTC